MKLPFLSVSALALMALPAFAACGGDDDDDDDDGNGSVSTDCRIEGGAPPVNATMSTTGLQYCDTEVGEGESPSMASQVTVHYTGRLASNGEVFDSSVERGQPATFAMNRVILGFSEGLLSMKVGGKRTIYIPSELGYGPAGSPPDIPPNADLIFELELLGVK